MALNLFLCDSQEGICRGNLFVTPHYATQATSIIFIPPPKFVVKPTPDTKDTNVASS